MVLVGDWCESCFFWRFQVGLLMNCYLVEVMVWIEGLGLVGRGVVGLWRMMDLALVIGECVMMWFSRRGDFVFPTISWSYETWRSRCDVLLWRSRCDVLLRLLRLLMLDVELVVNLCRSSRAFSRNCCVFGIIVRLADWLIDFYLKWCGVWWCRLFWIGNLNNVRGGCRSR